MVAYGHWTHVGPHEHAVPAVLDHGVRSWLCAKNLVTAVMAIYVG
jgi:hypothetical protein